jgi:3-oxoacyl-[acyl-carrier-protein] synthase II
MCHVAACASGSISIGEAFLKIRDGFHDIFIAGAADASITPLTLAGFAAMRAIYTGEDKKYASIPFNKKRDGFLIGEGAGVLVLEELSHALKRKAKIYAEIVGYASNSDAFNMVSPDYEGLSSKDAMLSAIACSRIEPSNIGYINAHGTSTVLGDKTEAKAIREVWDNECPLVSSIKSQIGHLLSASGAVEAIATVLILESGTIPGSIYKLDLDDDCVLNIPEKEQKINTNYALSNSFGFGGHNACLVFKKWSGQ